LEFRRVLFRSRSGDSRAPRSLGRPWDAGALSRRRRTAGTAPRGRSGPDPSTPPFSMPWDLPFDWFEGWTPATDRNHRFVAKPANVVREAATPEDAEASRTSGTASTYPGTSSSP